MKEFALVSLLFALSAAAGIAGEGEITFTPKPYERALRNPMKGFTLRGNGNDEAEEWATLRHTYIKWNEIEEREEDGIDKIKAYCDEKWKGYEKANVKAIPRVYLHWSNDKQMYWPGDMKAGDYSSPQFKNRVVRLIERLGRCWDDDPRVAFVEMGIIGKWGEHHSPSPSGDVQELMGAAFATAFKNKKVSIRHVWGQFRGHGFGAYWDSWAHADQMNFHGMQLHATTSAGLWKKSYIGGEVAYDWGAWKIQPGDTPTDTVANPVHRIFMINTLRWLHCTQLRWITDYDLTNPEAVKGAEEIQKTFGYRYVLKETTFSTEGDLNVSFNVVNEGAAPFYYRWPVEVSLLNQNTRKPVWTATLKDVDIRTWLPGDDIPNYENWNGKLQDWRQGPKVNTVKGSFKVSGVPKGTYILALAILDPGGNVPSLRFATANYIKGGRHPIGLYSIGTDKGGPLPKDFRFDDPHTDTSLYYKPRD